MMQNASHLSFERTARHVAQSMAFIARTAHVDHMLRHWFRDRATIREPMAVRNIGGQHMYKLVTSLIGLALAAVVVVALAGVGSEVKAQLAPVIRGQSASGVLL
jgi:hypothetical protein